ncbi:homogeneously-staining region [Tanacetum coccineum]
MTQRKYTLDLLKLASVLDTKPCATPIEPNTKLNLTDGTLLSDPNLYRTLVGKLIYLTITRPNISFTAQSLRQVLFFPENNSLNLLTYCDNDWASYNSCEISWLTCLLKDLQVQVPTHVPIQCDNASTIALASNPIHHARTKHIEIDSHFVRNKIKAGEILPSFVPSKSQVADIFTKGQRRYEETTLCSKLIQDTSKTATQDVAAT